MSLKTQPSKKSKISLETLAADLAFNIIDNATHGYDDDEYDYAVDRLIKEGSSDNFKTDKRNQRIIRNILIIGAGASKDLNENIFQAKELLDFLKSTSTETGFSNESKEKIEYLKDVLAYGGDFTSSMQVYAEMMGDEQLRETVRRKFNHKYTTSLYYEIVSHMFKHKLIDVIINYNFDEILDNVLEDEMGKTEYQKVFLNGDVPTYNSLLFNKNATNDIKHKLATPIYIKPHGTISYPETLQYTNLHYYRNGYNKVNKLIKDILNGTYEKLNAKKNKELLPIPINIISTGYAYQDSDLASMLFSLLMQNQNVTPEKVRPVNFFVFDKADSAYFKDNSNFIKKISTLPKTHEYAHFRCGENGDYNDLGAAFEILWSKTGEVFKEKKTDASPSGHKKEQYLRPLGKHKFMSLLFGGELNDDPTAYIKARTYIELAILMGKTDGNILHFSQIEESRASKYYNLYRKYSEETTPKNLYEFVEDFSFLKPYMNFSDTYQIDRELCSDGISEEIFDICFQLLAKELTRFAKCTALQKKEMRNAFIEICERNTLYIVNPNISEHNLSPFHNLKRVNYLYNDIRWEAKSDFLLANGKWNVMLNISENGELIKKISSWPNFKQSATGSNNKKYSYAILADHQLLDQKDNNREVTQHDINNCITIDSLKLPWQIHNKHMSLFLKVTKNHIEFIGGIYFTRRLLTNIVNPIYISGCHIDEKNTNIDKLDAKHRNGNILFNFFCNYWLNARIFSGDMMNSDKIYLKLEESDFLKNRADFILRMRRDLGLDPGIVC